MKVTPLLKPIDPVAGTVDLLNVGEAVVFNVLGQTSIASQFATITGTWGTGVLTMEVSLDGVVWVGFGTPVTYSAAAAPDPVSIKGRSFVRYRVSTANGASCQVKVLANGVVEDD